MSKQSKSNASTIDSAVSDESPGANFQIFVDMQNLYNKLKLLNYDNEYVSEWRMKPLSRIYFAIQTNSGEQLHSFLSLASWLFQKAGYKYEKPSEDDDQSVLLQNIIGQFRKMGYEINFGANKLRSGSGESVVYFLNKIADEALKKTNFTWRRPEKPEEVSDDDQPKDEESEVDMNKIDEEMFNKLSLRIESKSDDIVIHFPIQYKHPKKPVNLTNNNDFSNLTLNDIQTTILNIFKTAKTFIDELKTTGLLKRNNVYELKELSLAVYK
ncbi:unnamed protein product [Didymodactylos carnosus]|uniref:Uncharacterized protein n=1 Tax=Didymodactylos carnosus TaxID=1234261 RepID=A0A815FZD7_9BILA|nr:unnamed protein product [Didymodactylos carnosus]CAF4186150.1 unnamed protein product [Didymodactylos carnosus]